MEKNHVTILKAKIPAMVGSAGLAIIVLGCALLATPLRITSLSNSSKTAKQQALEAGTILSLRINASANVIVNHAYLISYLVETDLVPKENKRALILSELEIMYKRERDKAFNNLWCTFEPNALDGMDAQFINRVGSNQRGIFSPWFIEDKLTVDPSTQDYVSSYYTIPKTTKKEAVSEPYWDTINGKRMLMITFSAPILLNDTFLGVLGTDFYIDDLNELVSAPKLIGSGKLVTDNGIIVVHDNPELIGTTDNIDYNAIMEKAAGQGLTDEFLKSGKQAMYRVCVPLDMGEGVNPWLYVIEVPAKQIYAEARKTVGLVAIILVLLALSIYFYVKTVEKNSKLKDLNRVKDKLFSVVAHDLRSPIGELISVLELIKEDMVDAETQTQLLKDVSNRVNDIYGLLDNLLRWAKSQMQGVVLSPVYFDAQSEVRKVTDTLQIIAASKKIALNSNIEKQEVYADRDLFDVVTRNLITNALKFTSAGGEVSLNSELSGKMLVISVKDTGTGMSQEVQDKLFKMTETKSKRGTNNESGTGLGLVLCADLVKANGGKIWFTSAEGKGSTFYFSVPVKS